jgi:glutathione synthase/RimK-type ligase-like ATP-grasp enzyme
MNTSSSRYSMGILSTQMAGDPPFGSQSFYRNLCLVGSREELDVFVFAPQDVDWLTKTINGFIYDELQCRWICRNYPLPDVVYDRCFFTTREQYMRYRVVVRRLREEHRVLFLGCGLKGKWDVHRMLGREGRFDRHLPQTEVLRSEYAVVAALRMRGQVILKPQAGSQGRGVLLVEQASGLERGVTIAAGPMSGVRLLERSLSETVQGEVLERPAAAAWPARLTRSERPAIACEPRWPSTVNADPAFTVRGRDARNRRIASGFADEAALLRWLRRFTARRSYLQQQYLLLQTRSGDAYDVRSLVQKDGAGRWQVTGMAVRRGQGGSLTSNLHGGGTVEPVGEFLASQFDSAKAESLLRELHLLSELIPQSLEACHGRLAELGIDFGIDIEGHIWILEVNSKPGRSIFTYLHDHQARTRALVNPIRYARFLIKQTQIRNQIWVTGLE